MRILVIEDELRMLELLRNGLYESGFTVMTAADGEAGLAAALAHEFDAIVLDIGLPHRDGYSVAQVLRQRRSATPLLMLTARDAEDDIIRGLDHGADDYMTKPFSFPELVARIESIMRPHRANPKMRVEAAGLLVDPVRHLVRRGDASIELTRTEFALFGRLVRSAGSCVSRELLTEYIWGAGHNVSPGALDVLVNAVRRKIDAPFKHKLIRTIRGEGYALKIHPTAEGIQNR
jgi:two-component system copper resistance phosphate regulon response regulator CusR/two-component system response regulator MprA